MALETFAVGQYTGTYNATSPGITRGGYELEQTLKEEVINESDAYGGAMLDYCYRGGDSQITFTAMGYKPGSVSPLWPWGSALGVMVEASAPIGRLASDVASALVLTAVANTPAAVTGPATLTANKAILAPGFNSRHLYNSKLRELLIKVQLLPYILSSITRWFTIA